MRFANATHEARRITMLPEAKPAQIINRGRGPEIAGTRITVYSVMDFLNMGWHRDRIAMHFRLSSRHIQAAMDYIDAHQEEVTNEYNEIVNRHKNYKYPPEVQALVDASRGRAAKRLEEIRARQRGNGSDADHSV
jgi:uncharacterized protein (DUF433 family)